MAEATAKSRPLLEVLNGSRPIARGEMRERWFGEPNRVLISISYTFHEDAKTFCALSVGEITRTKDAICKVVQTPLKSPLCSVGALKLGLPRCRKANICFDLKFFRLEHHKSIKARYGRLLYVSAG